MRRKSSRKPDAGRKSSGPPTKTVSPAPPAAGYQLKAPLIGMGLVFIALVAFSGICTSEAQFIDWDDDEYVYANPHVRKGLTTESIGWAFTAFHSNNWHPLTWLSLQLDHELFGLEAWGYHQTNVLLHAANTLLLFLVLRWMTGADWQSAFVAGLFGVHPLHVESVAWVSERKDVLSALFWMLTMLAYVWYARSPRWQRYALMLAAFALGLMAKPMLVTLPCVLLLLDYWPLRRLTRGSPPPSGGEGLGVRGGVVQGPSPLTPCPSPSEGRGEKTGATGFKPALLRQLLLEKLPLLVLAAVCSLLTIQAQEQLEHSLGDFPLHIRLMNALVSYVRYIINMVWPVDLAAFYPHLQDQLPVWWALASLVVLLAITVLVLKQRQARPYLAVGWFWYLGTLVPVIGLVQVGMQALADRYTYIPLIGLFMILAWGGAELCSRWQLSPALRGGIVGVLLLACLVLTWNQVLHWRNSVWLWGHAIAVTKDNWTAHYNLGLALRQFGHLELAAEHLRRSSQIQPRHVHSRFHLAQTLLALGKPEEAEEELQAAVLHRPDFSLAHFTLGQLRLEQGRVTEAAEHFRACVQKLPESVEANYQLGTALLNQGKFREAAVCFETALRGAPNHQGAHTGLGLLFALEREWDGAIAHLERARRPAPADGEWRFTLAWVQQERGQMDAAREEYRQALQQDPKWPATAARQAWLLATHPDPNNRNGKLAVQRATVACEATGYQEPAFIDALAAAQAESGKFSEAAASARRALDLAKSKDHPRSDAIEMRLRLYESGQAFREADPKQPTGSWSYHPAKAASGAADRPQGSR